MKVMRVIPLIFLSCLSLTIFLACTKNPFGGDEISGGNRQIRGQVRFTNGSTQEDIYIWLEGFDVGTRTDQGGQFQLTLPPPASQGGQGGLSGAFNLYFYLANFKLASVIVGIRNGSFLYSNGEINGKGELIKLQILYQILKIRTALGSKTVFADSNNFLAVEFNLEPQVNSAIIFFPAQVGNWISPVIFRRTATDEVFIFNSVIAGLAGDDTITLGPDPIKRTVGVSLDRGILPRGEYEIIPYLLVKSEPVPAALIASLGEGADELGPNYLRMPFHREGDRLRVE